MMHHLSSQIRRAFASTRLSARGTFALVVAVLITIAATAQAALSAIGDSRVEFRAVGPAGLKIDGVGSGIKASESGGVLKVAAPLTNLKTGISLRDDHLKKALNVKKHPTATLAVERSKLKFPEDKKTVTASATGQFTLNGTTKPVKFDYKVERTGSDYHVQGRTEVDITDFKIEKPCYLGVCVDEDVKVKVNFKLRDK